MDITKDNWHTVMADVLADDAVHGLCKDTIRAALTKDCVDAAHDLELASAIISARCDALLTQ